MEGITILETIALTEPTICGWIVSFLGIILFVISMFCALLEKKTLSKCVTYICIGSIIIIFGSLPIFPFQKETGKYQYKCEIDKTITIGDIEEQYNIIEIKDSIWTLEDK